MPTAKIIVISLILAALTLTFIGTDVSWAKKEGFDTETSTTMGSSGNDVPNDNAGNSQGTKEDTKTGPKGALKNDNEPDDNVTESSSGPGNSQH